MENETMAEVSAKTTLAPLPDFATVMEDVKLLRQYRELYNHYFFGAPLPANFPQSIIKQYPSAAYKLPLDMAIVSRTTFANGWIATQSEYLADYYSLYVHYANGIPLPANFPQAIVDHFPSKNYVQQLLAAITQLKIEINQEKAAM